MIAKSMFFCKVKAGLVSGCNSLIKINIKLRTIFIREQFGTHSLGSREGKKAGNASGNWGE